MSFYFVFFWLFYRRLVAVYIALSPICYDVCLCRLGTIMNNSDDKKYSIGQKLQIMVVNML